MYNRTLAYEVCKTHVDDTSTKMYNNDIKRQGKFTIFFGGLPAKRHASEWRVRNYGTSVSIVGPSVKNAERPLEKQYIYIPHTLLSIIYTAINSRGLAAFPV